MTQEMVPRTAAMVLYDGSDQDGVVRDGAFRTQSKIVAIAPTEENRLAAVFVLYSRPDLESFLTGVRTIDPVVPIWLISEISKTVAEEASKISTALKPERLAKLFNTHRIQGLVARTPESIEKAIRRGLDERNARINFIKSRKELGLKNRQLHDLQENLEKIVTERTSHLSDAERELHQRSQNTRELVRFIKDLSQTESIEEILQLLSLEVRSFHEVRSPFLALVSAESGARLYFQQARSGTSAKTSVRAMEKGWGSRSVSRVWPHRSSIRLNEADDQAYFAQELGRPMARTIVIPLGKETRAGADPLPSPLIVFEHSFDEVKAEKFKKFLLPRLESLSTALDRVVINRETHAASRLWESTFDGIADPIAVIDSSYRVLRMNEAFARYESAENSQGRCFEIFANRKTPCDGCHMKSAVESGVHADWQARRGQDVYAVNVYPIRFSHEREVGTLINHYADVTKSLELKGQTFQGEKMAAIGLMAGNIAHELNNPLAGLMSLAQVLGQDPRYPQSVKNDMREIEMAAERSSAIIRDLMDFSRAEGRVRQKVSLSSVAERALNMVKTALHEHSVDTDWSTSADVMVDPHLLQHVIFNIVNNACQAMKEPGEIHLRTIIEYRGKERVAILEVSDTGPGIPDEVISRIFEPFFTTKGAGQGTGLGLSMSRWVVESFGGVIEPSNRTDRSGALFRIQLPVAEAE